MPARGSACREGRIGESLPLRGKTPTTSRASFFYRTDDDRHPLGMHCGPHRRIISGPHCHEHPRGASIGRWEVSRRCAGTFVDSPETTGKRQESRPKFLKTHQFARKYASLSTLLVDRSMHRQTEHHAKRGALPPPDSSVRPRPDRHAKAPRKEKDALFC